MIILIIIISGYHYGTYQKQEFKIIIDILFILAGCINFTLHSFIQYSIWPNKIFTELDYNNPLFSILSH